MLKFSVTHVNSMFRDGTLPVLYRSILSGVDRIPVLLLGDLYTLPPNLMKEFTTCTTNVQVMFDDLLRSSRKPIECTYGRLKGKWQILNKPVDLELEHVPQIMHSCFVLYSFCEINGMRLDNDRVQRQIELDKQMQPTVAPDRVF